MTFKDLQKLVQSKSSPEQSPLLQRLREKPFWIWDQGKHRREDIKTKGDCCFNHIIGLPKKENREKPMFDYEKLLYDSLLIADFYNPLKHTFKLKHLWVKKATGLGVTEFFLRFMVWLCLRDNHLEGDSAHKAVEVNLQKINAITSDQTFYTADFDQTMTGLSPITNKVDTIQDINSLVLLNDSSESIRFVSDNSMAFNAILSSN